MTRIFQLIVLAYWVSIPQIAAAQESSQTAQRLEVQIRVQLDYWLSLPKDYSKDGKPSPLMLFLHGAGERGDDLDLVKKHGPPKLIAAGKDFPFVVVSPQCPKDERWEASELSLLLDEIIANHNIDEDRIYVTGLSMGGYGTWSLAVHSPERFAAIAPICGGGDSWRARRIAKLPTWVFHGAKDRTVPLERSQEMVDSMKKAGGNPKFTIYPEAGHDSWTESYDNPELYSWFLSHRRAESE